MDSSNRRAAQDWWLRFYNRFVYNALAPAYNAIDWMTFGAWWRLVRRALDYVPPDGRILEVGFGPGKLQLELARSANFSAGVDLAWGMCRLTHGRLSRSGLIPKITRGSVFTLPYPSNTFDTVVSTFAFSGFTNGQAAMDEMVRVTAENGRVVLVDIGLPPDGNRLGTSLAHLWERMGDFLYDMPGMMETAGLTVTENHPFGPGHHIYAVVGEKRGEP
ncbi:MAG: methyltransferase domain-containing protein [Candidatus Promineifilaceae bacterium]